MAHDFRAKQISERVYWVGAIDWAIRDFHGYATSRGTTYNAYLILGSEPILVDTVKAPFCAEMMERVRSVIEPSKIRHIVSNHAEMDHSGCLPDFIELIRPDTIIASGPGEKALKQHFHWDHEITVVKDGARLELGDVALRFLETRMLHWPDSMFSFVEGDGVLFSNDGFGMHLASSERFVDELPLSLVRHEASKYYANILTPFSGRVEKVLAKVQKADLPIQVIATDHGPVWRKDLHLPIEWYEGWSAQKPTNRAVVVYDTMWGSTARMAHVIVEELMDRGVQVKLMPLAGSHRSEVATEVLHAGALLIGSPTLNGQLYPTVADILCYLQGLRPKHLVGAAFGSYGWSGQAVGLVEEQLEAMKVDLPTAGVRTRYVPEDDALDQCRALAASVAEALAEKVAG